MGKGSRHLLLRSNSSHTLCFQGPGSTAIRFSVESCAPSWFGLEVVSRGVCSESLSQAGSEVPVQPQEADPCLRHRTPAGQGGSGPARLHHQQHCWDRQQDQQPRAPHTHSCPRCHVCTFPRTFIRFKEEEARKINEVSPGRGVSGYGMCSVLIKDAETSSPLSRAPAVSTCCNNKLCSKNLAFHILCVKYEISNGLQTAYN